MRPPKIKPCRICGKPVKAAPRTDSKKGYYYRRQCDNCKNKPRDPIVWHHNMSKSKIGSKNPKHVSEGSTCLTSCGKNTYRLIKINGIWEYEHRVIMEEILNRPLSANEVIHHKDRNTLNNAPSNLEVLDRGIHMSNHLLNKPKTLSHRENIKMNHWRRRL
jgi:hypothetical protein